MISPTYLIRQFEKDKKIIDEQIQKNEINPYLADNIKMDLDFAIDALEKQTSRKVVPIESEDETIDMETGEWNPYTRTDWTCPICGEYTTPYDDSFCSNCGQKLDWSEYYY